MGEYKLNDINTYIADFKRKKRNVVKVKLPSKSKKISNFITKVLVSIILFLISLIYIKTSDKNLLLYKEYVFTESLPFTKIKNWYEDLFGEVAPQVEVKEKTVFSGALVYKQIEDYQDGEKLVVNSNSLVSNLNGGIVVYIGEKEGYGNTVIVQGNDGADIWYGNIQNVAVKLYDYIEKDTPIGEVNGENLYLVIKKDNNFIKYEEYKN